MIGVLHTRLKGIRQSVTRSIENHGPVGALKLVPRAAKASVLRTFRRFSKKSRAAVEAEARFDQETGVTTNGGVELAQLRFDDATPKESIKHGVRYQATPPHVFNTMLARCQIDYSKYQLIDVGSGKGRVLFMAAMHPFKRVTGVEFSPELTAVAKENIGKFHSPNQACKDIVAVCADATEYDFPKDSTVLYMYNPFAEQIMERVVANLERSLNASPRDVVVIYYNARCPGPLDRSNALREVASQRTAHGDEDPWVIYRSRST